MNEPELKSILVTTFLFITLLGCVFLYRLKSPDAIAPDNTDHWSASIMDKDYSGDAFINGKLNINYATAEDLKLLPGIGQSLADRIIEFRQTNGPFTNIIELTLIEGFSQERFSKIADYITVEG